MSSDKFVVEVLPSSTPGCCVLRAAGVLDAESAPIVESAVRDLYRSGIFNIIVDLGEVDFISSAGWGVFTGDLKEARQKGGDIQLVNLQPDVLDIFLLLELDRFINYHGSLEEALRNVGTKEQPVSHPEATEIEKDVNQEDEESGPAVAPEEPELVPTVTEAEESSEVHSEGPLSIPLAEVIAPEPELPPSTSIEKFDVVDEAGNGLSETLAILGEEGVDNDIGFDSGEVSDQPQVSESPKPASEPEPRRTLAGGRWGLWRRIFGRKPKEARREPSVAPLPSTEAAASIDWEARREPPENRYVVKEGGAENRTSPVLPAHDREDGNGSHGDREGLSETMEGLGAIAAVVRENPLFGPTRIKRRLEQLNGEECSVSVTTIYRRLRAARLNTRELRVQAVRLSEEETV